MLLDTRAISKSFGVTRALDAVDFSLASGEVHVLFGENGAGKSTLVKILSGAYAPDAGHIAIDGTTVEIRSPHDARRLGIATVFQDFSLIPTISVLDNLFLGKEQTGWGLLDRRAMRERARTVMGRLRLNVNLNARVDTLARADQQMVEIAKALLNEARVLILDEPTSSLTEAEADHLFAVVDGLKADGVGVILISHHLNEVISKGDRITVLRDGSVVATVRRGEVDEEALIRMIVGRSRSELFPPLSPPGADIAVRFADVGTDDLSGISFDLRQGEILGVAGLAGSGAATVGRALFGLERVNAGTIRLGDRALSHPSPRRMLAEGVIYFPSDRHGEALLTTRDVKENLTIEALGRIFSPRGLVDRGREKKAAATAAARLQVKAAGIDAPITTLSGGNQQKVVLARGLVRDFKVLVLDDPTIGVDMQTKSEIYHLLAELARQGTAIILISSDLEELMAMSHRMMVMRGGRMAAPPEATAGRTKEHFLSLFFPGANSPAAERVQ